MAHFEQAYKITMGNEGGYVNDPDDHGGETWSGVSRKNHAGWAGWKIVEDVKATHPANLNHALAARADLQALVLALYSKNYWDNISLGLLQCQQTANQLFDVSVNCGSTTAAKFLQQAVNVFHQPALKVDGMVGPLTIGAANRYPSQKIYDEINKLRKKYYEGLAANSAKQGKYLQGWLSRIHPYQTDSTSNIA